MPSPSQFANTLDDSTLDPDADVLGVDDVSTGDKESKGLTPTNAAKAAIDRGTGVFDLIRSKLTGKNAVRVATTGPVAWATGFQAGEIVDDVTLAEGDRVLNKDATDGTERGILIVPASGAPSFAPDLPAGANAAGVHVVVTEGTANGDTEWKCESDTGSDVVGTDSLVFGTDAGGSGDVVGPASATDNAVARFDTTTGKLIQNSTATLSDGGDLHVAGDITLSGTVDGRNVSSDGTALDAHVAASNPHSGSLATSHEGAGGGVHADAVASGAAGFMTGADKAKLDGLESGADVTDPVNVAAAGAVMDTRTVGTTAPLTGGGALSSDLTLGIDAATASARGSIELATQGEVDTGTDTVRAVTPATLTGRDVAGMGLTQNRILIGNGSNNAAEVGGGGAAVAMGSPWCTATASDPDETDTGYGNGWRWINTANGKIWVNVASGVWRCENTVVEDDSGTGTTRTVDNTWDGSIKRYTGAVAEITINVPTGLNNGLTFEAVAAAANQIITVTMSGGSVRIPASFVASTEEQYSSIVVTVLNSNEILVRGHLEAAP